MKLRLIFLALVLSVQGYAQISGAGQLGCSGATTTGTVVTSATSNNTDLAVFSNTSAYGMLVQLNQTTTVTAGAITFQVSNDGGTNYITAPLVLNVATGAALTNPYTLVASTNQAFLVVLAGAANFKVRLTTGMTGSGSITPFITPICSSSNLALDSSGNLKVNVNVALPAGTNLVGEAVGVATATITDSALGCYLVSAASTNSTNCKASAGNLYGLFMVNTTATVYYLRLYNSSSAPTCSSATGFIETIPVPASTTGAGIVLPLPVPIGYSTGISFCFTGGSSSTDNTNAATGVFGAVLYK